METGAVWAIGEAAEGGLWSESTFVLVSNGSANAGQVRLTVAHDDGMTEQKTYALPGNARLTIRVLDDFANTLDRRFSLLVESLGDGGGEGAPLTVECARYQSASGRFGEAGGVALATRIR
ncbi:MAG: hypothetical protein ACRDUY_15860 [Nitriliruptorales bacterium]